MLRAIFFHQCDSCRNLYEALNTVVEPDPDSWAEALYHLGVPQVCEINAWCLHPWTGEKTCPACVPEIEDVSQMQCQDEEDFQR